MTFTASQEVVLNEISKNRLTVVRAGPGAGKTRVFIEAFRREIERTSSPRFGVAALSFTNVAHEEITRRMDRPICPPHFVGTLDAFMWRFVVRPFGDVVGLSSKGPRLLPAPLDEMQNGPVVQYGPEPAQRATVFEIQIAGGDEVRPTLRYNNKVIERSFAVQVMDAKRREWLRNGRVTHSDAQFMASSILRGPNKEGVCKLLARRFPVVLVDEFQDTGHFLGRALLSLLETPTVRGAVVGDPDQAIYQFGGASRGLFDAADQIPDARGAVLDQSHRCPRCVAAVATELSRSGKAVVPVGKAAQGQAILLVHDHQEPDLPSLLSTLPDSLRVSVVLARKTRTVRKLNQGVVTTECPAGCKFARGINRAVENLLTGNPTMAARILWKELGGVLLDDEDVDDYKLLAQSISVALWRSACHRIIFEAAQVRPGETWNEWIARLKSLVASEATRLGQPINKLGTKIRSVGADGTGLRFADPAKTPTTSAVEVITVHQAKGREFPVVMVYYPKAHKTHAPCPSTEWWSEESGKEEKEVAFVACTRSEQALVLAIHRTTFVALQSSKPEFIALFDPIINQPVVSTKNKRVRLSNESTQKR